MKCFVAVLGLLTVTLVQSSPVDLASYHYANPGGVTYRGNGFNPDFTIGPAQPVQQYAAAPVQQYAAAPVQHYAAAPVQHYAAAPAYQYAPAVAVHQKVGYAHHQVPVQVPGVADVPVTKLALTQGVTQKLVDVAQPAVTNRKIKVRRPALRKEFYDIEHRVIVRPAGSATLELSQPVGKEQTGPAVLTPTNYQQIAPVVRYGLSRQIIDGQEVSELAQTRVNLARGIQAAPAPAQQPEFRAAQPQQQQQQSQPQLRAAEPQQQQQAQPQGPQPEFRAAAPQQQQQRPLRPLQLRPPTPQQSQQQQQQAQPAQQQEQPQLRSADAEIIDADSAPQQQPQQPQLQQPQQQQSPQSQGARLALPPGMPAELQARLLELLSAKGGTVTEYLGENGQPNSASVIQVAEALQDVNLHGGERTTTRRIVITRPIETIQEVDIQEPATKFHRTAVNVPTLFKTPIQGIARVPVSLPAIKNVATPVVQTQYTAAAYSPY